MSTEINKYRKIAREHFKNNHPLVQKWEAEGVKWDLHHWDTTLRHTNKKRYDMYIIEDLVPMTHSWHQSMHHSNMSEETRKKMSDAQKGERNHMYGKHLSDEARKKMSEALSGEKNPWYGKHHSEETRKKLSESQRGEKHHMYGKHHSEETRKKLSEAKRGEQHPMYGKPALNRKKVICVETGQIFNSLDEANRWLCKGDVRACLAGRAKTAGGYHWEYYKE